MPLNTYSARRLLLRSTLRNFASLYDGDLNHVKILDVGGSHTSTRSRLDTLLGVPNLNYTVVNPDAAQKPDYQCEVGDLGNSQYDIIFALEVIEYQSDIKKFTACISSLLADTGILVVSCPFMHATHGEGSSDLIRLTKHGLASHLRTNGFQIKHIEAQGSIFSVIYDAIRCIPSYVFPNSLILQLISGLTYLLTKLDVLLPSIISDYVSTGYLITCEKKSHST